MDHRISLKSFQLFPIGLGTNRITNTKEARELLGFARDQGINFFDTANIYQDGDSECAIARALHPYAQHLCIATKGGFKKNDDGSYVPEGHPEKLKQNVEDSLKRLQLSHIDLYQLHRIDPKVPLEDSLGMLKALQDMGKIRHIGLSDVSVAQIKQAETITQVASVQNRYNVFERKHEDVVAYCHEQGIIFIPFYPLGSPRHLFPEQGAQMLKLIAAQYQKTPEQVALAWALHRSPQILPIPGTLSKKHVLDNIAALTLELLAEDVSRLDLNSTMP